MQPQLLAPSESVQLMQAFDKKLGGRRVVILVFGDGSGGSVVIGGLVGETVIIGNNVRRKIVLKVLLGGDRIDIVESS